jgi:hypothetical protein
MQDIFRAMEKFKKWKREHPDEIEQSYIILDLATEIEASELWAVFNFVLNNYDINY